MIVWPLILGGCAMTPPDNQDLTSLLGAYRAQSAMAEQRRRAFHQRGIRELEVTGQGGPAARMRVSADLSNASLAAVLERLIEQTGLSYNFGTVRLAERVSVRFKNRSLNQTMAELLTPVGYRARIADGILSIERAEMPVQEATEEGQRLQAEIPLKYIDTEFAEDLLDGIYTDDDGQLSFAMNPVRNSAFLSGESDLVQAAETLLRKADTDAGHILIEVLVVEFNTEALRKLGAQIFDAAGGSFNLINLDFGALAAEQITFTHVADTENITQLTAMLNVLIEDSQARIISRPYVATLSNQTANLSITDDRYVTVTDGDGDANLERVNSGVELEVTPIVQWDGMIRMAVDLTESKFVGGADATNLRQTRNNVETTMRIADGETIIIGGLMLNGFNNAETGLPGLRDTPLLGMVFGQKDQQRANRQVVMYITPHLWTPGMDTPLVNQEPMPPLPPPEVQWRETHDPAITPGG